MAGLAVGVGFDAIIDGLEGDDLTGTARRGTGNAIGTMYWRNKPSGSSSS